jgi:hypothetical protein
MAQESEECGCDPICLIDFRIVSDRGYRPFKTSSMRPLGYLPMRELPAAGPRTCGRRGKLGDGLFEVPLLADARISGVLKLGQIPLSPFKRFKRYNTLVSSRRIAARPACRGWDRDPPDAEIRDTVGCLRFPSILQYFSGRHYHDVTQM